MESFKNTMENAGNTAKGALTTVENNASSAASSARGELGQLSTSAEGFSRKALGNLNIGYKKVKNNLSNLASNVGSSIGEGTRKLRARVGVGGIKRRRKSTKKRGLTVKPPIPFQVS